MILWAASGVLALAVLGYAQWVLGTNEREALTQRTALETVERSSNRWINRLDGRLRRTAHGRWLQMRLDRAGVRWRMADIWLALAGLAVVTYLLSAQLLSWWFAVLAAAAAVRLALTVLDRREARRREDFVGQLPEVARVLSNATSAGLALRSAIRMAGEDLEEPAGSEMARLARELDVGTPLSDALDHLQQRMPSRELALLTRTLIIQARAGGAVVTALRGMSETLEARKDLRREVRTMLSGAVFTSWIVLFLGAGSLLMMNVIAPGTLNEVTSSLIGQVVLVIALVMYAAGFWMIRRTTRIDV
ncbi:type II secretion system F family protein [Kineosporia rhizophila]|uniref:type II secretion system F family protein n=1 Tax=Kineosporia TaxID=49184 RepID=UPI001E31CE20|nr:MULTISPECIES: type II secretion system F family protein [Kineosporia]MCE0534324.1 type II secretion system F family protein [Kineosporia rhizophila]GLY13872.1 membrane protein [Kineosporia sp. NBRC 101677]